MVQISNIRLRARDLDRLEKFYGGTLGFVPAGRGKFAVEPGGKVILELEQASATPDAPPDAAGLFHAALLFARREDLGAWLQRAGSSGLRFDGFADHGVSEALYFRDPEGNGLEFYADRPADQWRVVDGEIKMYTHPLDLGSLLAAGKAAGNPGGILAGANWGHVHLRVCDLERSETFYAGRLEFDVTNRAYPGARFLAADGYHHHLGMNTWTRSSRPLPAGAPGLAMTTLASDRVAPGTFLDPDGIPWTVEKPG